jgi:uncharacterized protein YjbJ (UPF0337 family)
MDSDRIKGKIKQAEGRVQDAVGDLTDNPSDDIKGKAKQAEGKAQEAWGKSKDAMRRELNKP